MKMLVLFALLLLASCAAPYRCPAIPDGEDAIASWHC